MTTTATRGRGRPRTFDEEEVLDALTRLFWEQGYEATSVADISEVAGLNKSSLYNTFGSKQELFNRILERYINNRTSMLETLTEAAGGGVDSIHAFLDFVEAELDTDMGRHGCMAVNTSAELGGDDPTMTSMGELYRERMATALHALVQRAAETGELDPDQVTHHSHMLMIFVLGLSVTIRSGASREELSGLLAAAHANVESWRQDAASESGPLD
ncbi:MAG: TetR/AcrR family transcriptional regulator [Acidimicrobiales bacterium]